MAFHQKYAWLLPFGLGLLLGLSALAILFIGPDGNEFQASTGVSWAELQASMPEVAQYIDRLDRLIGASFAGFAFLWAAISFGPFRRGDRWSWFVLWMVPLVLGTAAAVFFLRDAAGLGAYYAGATGLALIGLLLPIGRFL